MKQVSDFTQFILQSGFIPALLLIFTALAFVLTPMLRLTARAVKAARWACSWVWSLFFPIVWVGVVPLTLLLAICKAPMHSALQTLENWYAPVYVYGDDARALAIYEAELQKRCDPYEYGIIKARTAEIAAKIGCAPLAIYEVAFWECNLNPFLVRRDGIAAGWIQFTSAGLTGLGVSLDQVKAWCKERNIVELMNLTEKYFVSRCAGRGVKDATDVYVAVFAPAFLGRPDETVLYDSGAAYSKNSGLDGFYRVGNQIARNENKKDGRITIGDLRLALEYKKAKLIRSYQPEP